MHYLLLDTNCYLNLISDTDNILQKLEYWTKSNEIKLILPDVIKIEWERNKESKKEELLTLATNFNTNIISKIGGVNADIIKLKEYYSDQISLIDNILENYSEEIITDSKLRLEVVDLAIHRKSIFKKQKTSIADGLAVFSLIKYCDLNQNYHSCFFVSQDSDYKKGGALEKTLEEQFDKREIIYIKELNHVFYRIKDQLTKFVSNLESSSAEYFISEKIVLDGLLVHISPTKTMIDMAFELIAKGSVYENYFFKKVKHDSWFDELSSRDYFSPVKSPGIGKIGRPYPLWCQTIYLKRLIEQNKFTDEIISIIINVTKNGPYNPRTFSEFIDLVSILPSKKISMELIELIPLWLKSAEGSTGQTIGVIDNLIPKLLLDYDKKNDQEKITTILRYLFESNFIIVNNERKLLSKYSDQYWLAHIIKAEYFDKLIEILPKEFIYIVIYSLDKLMLTDVVKNRFINSNVLYEKELRIESENIKLTIDFHNQSIIEIKNSLTDLFSTSYNTDLNDLFVYMGITTLSRNWCSNIEEYTNRKSYSHDDENWFFFTFLKEFLINLSKRDKEFVKKFISHYLNKNVFFEIYKRLSLFLIAIDWESYKEVLLNHMRVDQSGDIINHYEFRFEFYQLQNNINKKLRQEESELFLKYFKEKTKLIEDEESYKELVLLKLLTPFRDIDTFKNDYKYYFEKIGYSPENISDRIEGNTRSYYPTKSPITKEELLQFKHQELTQYLNNYQPVDEFKGASRYGLSKLLEAVVSDDPMRYSTEMESFLLLKPNYLVYLIYGLQKGVEKNELNWKGLIIFLTKYSSSYYSQISSAETDTVKKIDLAGNIAEIIDLGTYNNSKIPIPLLPDVYKLVEILIDSFKSSGQKPQDFTFDTDERSIKSHILNASECKLFSAMLSLISYEKESADEVIHSESFIRLLDKCFKKNIIEVYMFFGFYFYQMTLVDRNWAIEKINDMLNEGNINWQLYFHSYVSNSPIGDKEIISILSAHYDKYISIDVSTIPINNNGVSSHFISQFFWGFYDLEEGSLLNRFINQSSVDTLLYIIEYIYRSRDYPNNVNSSAEKNKFYANVIKIWGAILSVSEKFDDEPKAKIQNTSISLLSDFEEFDEDIYFLLSKAIKYSNGDKTSSVISDFYRINNTKTIKEISKAIDIISKLKIPSYAGKQFENELTDLIDFFYSKSDDGSVEFGKLNKICNYYSVNDMEFLEKIYNKYNIK